MCIKTLFYMATFAPWLYDLTFKMGLRSSITLVPPLVRVVDFEIPSNFISIPLIADGCHF